jgi:hypothetical protein
VWCLTYAVATLAWYMVAQGVCWRARAQNAAVCMVTKKNALQLICLCLAV